MELADKRAAIAYWAILSGFFAAYLWVHELAGFTFPIPWPDEGTFLWQALADPWGEAIVYQAFESERVKFTQPTFHSEKSDVSIVHLSRHLYNDRKLLPTRAMRKRVADWPLLHERDGSERWHYKIWTEAEQAKR